MKKKPDEVRFKPSKAFNRKCNLTSQKDYCYYCSIQFNSRSKESGLEWILIHLSKEPGLEWTLIQLSDTNICFFAQDKYIPITTITPTHV